MPDQILKTLTSPDGQRRVLIVRRPDGVFSFCTQCQESPDYKNWGDSPWPNGNLLEEGWNPPSLHYGLYDSQETATWEALCRVEWLANTLPPN